jgi:CDP-diacylglycerol--glycerol-3-phosphate 3-phosphatidyltransferase
MNTPNKLTLLRVLIAPFFMYFFLINSFYMRLIALALFVVAALTDLADGYYARKYGIVTGFGKFMDPLADKILVSSALVSFIALNYISPLPTMLIIGREFSISRFISSITFTWSGVSINSNLSSNSRCQTVSAEKLCPESILRFA